MRHKRLNKKFGRNSSQRKELMRSLVRALFISYRIETTVEKAKETRRFAEKLITRGIDATIGDIRDIESFLRDRALVSKLLKKISPLFKDRKGGYTRIMRKGFRRGDGAAMAILELVVKPAEEKKAKKQIKEKAAKPQAEKTTKIKKEDKPVESQPREEEKAAPRPKVVPPKAEKKPEKPPIEEEPKKEEKRPAEEKPAEDQKKGLFGKFKGFFKKDE